MRGLRASEKFLRYSLLAAGVFSTISAVRAAEETKLSPPEFFAKEIQPILQKHCYDCHGNEKQKGGVNLQTFDDLEKIKAAPELWYTAYERVNAFEMPPAGKGELDFNKQRKMVQWLRDLPKPENVDCDQIASDRNANFYRGFAMSRRLNRAEYASTVRDLFEVKVDVASLLPADGGGGEGFDTTGNALFTSSIHIEKYMAAADQVLRQVLPDQAPESSSPTATARARLLGGRANPGPDEARDAARQIVAATARRAFRRPVKPEEIERILTMFDRAWARGDGYLASLRLALKTVLVSPNFLFLIEPEPEEKGVQPLAPLPLASRLSYFLWSSMPDEELLALAESGKLNDPNTYREQVHRMLADPRALALGERFALQWLDLERLGGEVRPDPKKFPEFDAELQRAMLAEVKATFNYIITSDRPLTELIDADYVFADRSLGEFYGLSVSGAEVQKVSAPNASRGGVIGMAAVHALTSFPLRTSPVLRGRWVLEALLGEKVKPPPPDVPALAETAENHRELSLRQQLEKHRLNPECASCHDKMDPLGFGMENFDVLGRWRDTDRGQPIDARGTLPSGTSFEGPSGLKKVLMERKEEVVKQIARKLTGYAYGRELNKFDDCVIKKTMEELRANNYRPSILIENIALSFPFRHRFYPKVDTKLEASL